MSFTEGNNPTGMSALGQSRHLQCKTPVRFTPKADIQQGANIVHRKVIRSPWTPSNNVTGDVG